jgi:hypothetical protein
MVTTDTLEGVIDGTLRYHYDVQADVLYLKLVSAEETETYADTTDDGDLLLLDEKSDKPVGLTIISWWKRFGQGTLPDSLREIQQHIEPLGGQIAA